MMISWRSPIERASEACGERLEDEVETELELFPKAVAPLEHVRRGELRQVG